MTAHIGLVGDIHGAWSDADTAWFNDRAYDLLVVVGDLAGFRFASTLAVAQQLAELTCRTVVIPGNHDANHPLQQVAEAFRTPGLARPFSGISEANLGALSNALAPAEVGAYSLHALPSDLTVLCARPHSMGGSTLSFQELLTRQWGISSLEASAARLRDLIDASTGRLILIGHNGPTGLGGARADIWGCDFRPQGGDWGDRDLEHAVTYARETGREVLAVIAGHMHRRIRGGGQRIHHVVERGVHYVNVAEVPRIVTGRGRHHVELVVPDEGPIDIFERWIE